MEHDDSYSTNNHNGKLIEERLAQEQHYMVDQVPEESETFKQYETRPNGNKFQSIVNAPTHIWESFEDNNNQNLNAYENFDIDLSNDIAVNQLLADQGAPINPDAEVFDVDTFSSNVYFPQQQQQFQRYEQDNRRPSYDYYQFRDIKK